jgi:hypothetical protein
MDGGCSVRIARNDGFRPGGTQLRRPLATHLRAWGIENRLDGTSKRAIISDTAGGGRQRTRIWAMSDKESTTCRKGGSMKRFVFNWVRLWFVLLFIFNGISFFIYGSPTEEWARAMLKAALATGGISLLGCAVVAFFSGIRY